MKDQFALAGAHGDPVTADLAPPRSAFRAKPALDAARDRDVNGGGRGRAGGERTPPARGQAGSIPVEAKNIARLIPERTGSSEKGSGHCCRPLAVKDSHHESMRLGGRHEQGRARPLPRHQLA
jgi:hypothetical protein